MPTLTSNPTHYLVTRAVSGSGIPVGAVVEAKHLRTGRSLVILGRAEPHPGPATWSPDPKSAAKQPVPETVPAAAAPTEKVEESVETVESPTEEKKSTRRRGRR